MIVPREPPYPPTPRQPPDRFERRAAAAPVTRLIGLVGHLFGVGLYVLAPAVTAIAAVAFLADEETHLILRTAGFLVFATLAFLLLKSILPHRRRLPPAVIPVQPEDEPTVYAFAARVADDLGVPAPRRVFVGSGTELQLGGRRSLLDLVRRPRWELHIGLWLWNVLTLSEFQALVARTLAPMSGGRMERFRSNARALLDVLANGVDRVDEVALESDATFAGLARLVRFSYGGVTFPTRVVGRLLLRLDPVRDDALADDLEAVRVAGSDPLVHAILRSDVAAAALRTLDDSLDRAADAGLWTTDLFAHLADALTAVREAHNDFTLGEPPVLRGPTAGKYADVFEPGQQYLSRMWTGFPAPDRREQNAKQDFVAAERDDRPAAELLDDPGRLRDRLTWLRYVEVLETDDEYFPVTPATIRRWLGAKPDPGFPAKCAGCYDLGRKIDPGTPAEREAALMADPWDDARLQSTAANLYSRAGERAATWRGARAALDKLLQRTVYHPVGRTRALADDLEDDVRKAGRWLAALDRWAYVIHVHMAARLPDLRLHDALLARYESLLGFQSLTVDALSDRNRVAAFVRRLSALGSPTPYRLGRGAVREFGDSRRDLGAMLSEAAAIRDPLLQEWTGDVPLDEFLYAHEERPPNRARGTAGYGRLLLAAWDEIVGKARWINHIGVAALLELHEQIEHDFAARLPVLDLQPVAEASATAALPGMEPEVVACEPELAEFVPDVEEALPVDVQQDAWELKEALPVDEQEDPWGDRARRD